MDCIFCKIAAKEAPSDIIYEDEETIVIKDIHPKASVHLLLIPKKHIVSVAQLEESDKVLVGSLVLTAKKIADSQGLKGYKLVFNVGREGGQMVDHLHLHLLGGKVSEMP